MLAVQKPLVRRLVRLGALLGLTIVSLTLPSSALPYGHAARKSMPGRVKVGLSEWKLQLTPGQVPAGAMEFEVTNAGQIPHAFEVEGQGIERCTPQIQPGGTYTLKTSLRAGTYAAYCPVGKGSHKMLGMRSRLVVGGSQSAAAAHEEQERKEYSAGNEEELDHAARAHEDKMESEEYEHGNAMAHGEQEAMEVAHGDHGPMEAAGGEAKAMRVTGGGPVIQILPGPFPFADSAMAVIRNRPADQQADLTHKAHMGPYSNVVAKISGDISLLAIDRGASGDSVSGTADFTTQDSARWKLVLDRVQTQDIPFNPRFGGVIMGLFYHGASGVHTPLVPTIQSSLALWAFAHLYRNDRLVADNAMVHVMLLSRTRRSSDWALDCWDCSDRPVEELQLQITPAPKTAPFDAPGGFLFVNWEKSSGRSVAP